MGDAVAMTHCTLGGERVISNHSRVKGRGAAVDTVVARCSLRVSVYAEVDRTHCITGDERVICVNGTELE